MTDHEALEALSKKATQGLLIVPERDAHTDRTSAHINRNEPSVFIACMGKPTDQREADTLFLAALWNAYRTGQLIPAPSVDDAMVERVARAIANADLDGPDPEDYWQYLATAAISAMQVKP